MNRHFIFNALNSIQYFINNGDEQLNYINIGVESRTYVKDMARIVIEEMGNKAKIDYTGGDRGWVGDVPKYKYSTKKIKKLGFKFRIKFFYYFFHYILYFYPIVICSNVKII